MNIDFKNNIYLLSLVVGIVVAIINLVIDNLMHKEDKEPINYMNYVKIGGITSLVVLGTNMVLKGKTKNLTGGNISSEFTNSNVNSDIEVNNSSGLEEVNMNQKIHMGNPQF